MAVKADFHMHSDFSGDSSAPMEEMVQRAVSLGLTHICITEHHDPDYVYLPGEEGMFELNTDSYLYELLKLREKYKDQISVGFGVELGLRLQLKRPLPSIPRHMILTLSSVPHTSATTRIHITRIFLKTEARMMPTANTLNLSCNA